MRRSSSKKDKSKFKRKFKVEPPSRIRTIRISPAPFLIIIVAVAIFLITGGLYTITEQPPTVIATQDKYYYYLPFDINNQLVGESIIAMIYLAMGVGGFFAAVSSVKYLRSGKQSLLVLIVGLILIVLGVVGIQSLLSVKLSPG